MKKFICFSLIATMLLLISVPIRSFAESTDKIWKLVDIIDYKNEEGWALYEIGPYWFFDREYNRLNYYSKVYHSDTSTYVAYSTRVEWKEPPLFIMPGEKISLSFSMYEIENTHKLNTSGSVTNADFAPVGHGMTSRGFDLFSNKDGIIDFALNGATIPRVDETLTGTAPLAGYNEENQIALRIGYTHGTTLGTKYIYELVPADSRYKSLNESQTFPYGVKLNWKYFNNMGFRLYRTLNSKELGGELNDYVVTSNSYADTNLKPNTTYFYTIKPILRKADPVKGISEELGPSIANFSVKSGDKASDEKANGFISMQIMNPVMSVGGIETEVDPGRGTQPMIISGRTMVPVRAIVEAMGGSIDWDGKEQKIIINARGNKIELWIGKKEISVNGQSKIMDVTPVINNSRTYVPIRFVAENLNALVEWIDSTREAVIIFSK